MSSIDFRQLADLFSVIYLGTAESPGVVTLSGHDRPESWTTVKAKGEVGASSTHEGGEVGTFQASFYLASPEDQLKWPAFRRVIESTTSGTSPKALPVYHPDLAENRFTEVSNAGIGGAIRDSRGGVTYVVKFIEYRPPKPRPAATPSRNGTAYSPAFAIARSTVSRSNPPTSSPRNSATLSITGLNPV